MQKLVGKKLDNPKVKNEPFWKNERKKKTFIEHHRDTVLIVKMFANEMESRNIYMFQQLFTSRASESFDGIDRARVTRHIL